MAKWAYVLASLLCWSESSGWDPGQEKLVVRRPWWLGYKLHHTFLQKSLTGIIFHLSRTKMKLKNEHSLHMLLDIMSLGWDVDLPPVLAHSHTAECTVHTIMASLKLEKTSEITKSNPKPSSPCSLTRSLSAASSCFSNLQGWGLPHFWHIRAPSPVMTVSIESERAAYISQVLYLCLSYPLVLFHQGLPPKQA